MGKILPHGDGDGETKPDGEFPLPSRGVNEGGGSVACQRRGGERDDNQPGTDIFFHIIYSKTQ